jgi:glycosyltransferase involved in cell wall biosynthesis
MKIGILLISSNFAGAERAIKEILKKVRNKSDLILFTSKEVYPYFNDLNIKKYNLGSLFNKGLVGQFFMCKKIAKKIDYLVEKNNISLLNPVLEYSFLVSLLIASKIPIVCSLHGEEINNLKKPLKFLQNYIVKKALKKSKKLISVSKELFKNIPKEYQLKTIVIPNGVDSIEFRPLNDITPKKNIIFFVGRFIELKGIKEIINVAKQLPQYTFWFAGHGELENEIKGENIKNLGFKKTEELVRLYNQATICIFPSYIEAFALVGLEAMSCGKAVIATPIGFSEYIKNGKNGIIIPSKNESALKNAIVDLMTNESKRKLLEKNARKEALTYSWKTISRDYLALFKKLSK